MRTYTEMTQQFGDQWVAAVKRTEDAVSTVVSGINGLVSTVDLPKLPFTEQVTEAIASVGVAFPKPSEVIEANFALAERMLGAQREFATKLVDLVPAGASTETE